MQDAVAIASVHVRSWQGAYRGILPPDYLDGLRPDQRSAGWERIIAQADWPRAGTLVAEAGGELLGFANIRPTRDADADPAEVAELTSIYVLPEEFGKGFGSALMTEVLGRLREASYRRATLWVLDGNDRAIRFYRAAGWRPDGATKGDAIGGVGVTEVRFRQNLPP